MRVVRIWWQMWDWIPGIRHIFRLWPALVADAGRPNLGSDRRVGLATVEGFQDGGSVYGIDFFQAFAEFGVDFAGL